MARAAIVLHITPWGVKLVYMLTFMARILPVSRINLLGAELYHVSYINCAMARV